MLLRLRLPRRPGQTVEDAVDMLMVRQASASAVGEFSTFGWVGALSDRYGRKPLLQLTAAANASARLAVAVWPSLLTVWLAEVFGEAMTRGYDTTVAAALSDLCCGENPLTPFSFLWRIPIGTGNDSAE